MNRGMKALIAVVIVAVVVTATVLIFRPEGAKAQETELVFHTSPREVDVTVDGEDYGQVEAGETLAVPAKSNVSISVARKGFQTYAATVEVAQGETNQVHVALLPETDEAWKAIGEEEDLEGQREATERYLEDAEDAYGKYPILSDLPHKGHLFSISQGVAKTSGYDFGIYLNVYAGHEAEGREAFKTWMQGMGYKPDDYDVVEAVKKDNPLTAVPEPPTMAELEDASPADIKIPKKTTRKGLDVDELALKFAAASTTWDAAEDGHPTDALIRSKGLMTKKQAATTKAPHRPTTTPTWRTAAAAKARSQSWVSDYTTKSDGKDTTVATVKVCWAWISEDQPPVVDGPRTYELTINKKKPAIARYTYKDPDPFVDNSKTSCLPADA